MNHGTANGFAGIQVEELMNAAETGIDDAEDGYETIINLYSQRLITALDSLVSGYGPPEELDMKLTKFQVRLMKPQSPQNSALDQQKKYAGAVANHSVNVSATPSRTSATY